MGNSPGRYNNNHFKIYNMNLKKFINTLVLPNTLIRLWFKVEKGGLKEVVGEDKVYMEHELLRSNCLELEVLGVTDILYHKSPYVEAVNIVVKTPEVFILQITPKEEGSNFESVD